MRRTIWVLVVLAVLAGIGFAADRYAAHVAAGQIASAVQTDAKLARKPHVTVKGFPFLTQVANGNYKHIDVTATDIFQRGEPQGSVLKLDFAGVRLSISKALHGDVGTVPVHSVTGTVAIPFSDLLAAADIPGLTIISATPGGNQIKVGEVVSTGPTKVTALVTAGVTVRGGSLVLSALDVAQANGKPVPAAVRQQVLAQAVFSVKLPGLPTGVQMTAVSVTADGLLVTLHADALVLTH
jgi:LmeA-like phospholipid-binding